MESGWLTNHGRSSALIGPLAWQGINLGGIPWRLFTLMGRHECPPVTTQEGRSQRRAIVRCHWYRIARAAMGSLRFCRNQMYGQASASPTSSRMKATGIWRRSKACPRKGRQSMARRNTIMHTDQRHARKYMEPSIPIIGQQ